MKQFTWRMAITNSGFRKRLITGLILLAALFAFFPFFFQFIQQRQGIVLHDYLLSNIPAINVSVLLFICIWLTGLLIAIRAIRSPSIFINFFVVISFLSVFRIVTISSIALNPPEKLIVLADPLISTFYGKNFITKDLLFSGHTATLLLIYLCLEKKADRIIALSASVLVGVLVLVQHVHYTIDVIFAVPFAYLSWYLGLKLAGLKKNYIAQSRLSTQQ